MSYGGQWKDLCLFLPSHLVCLFPSFTHSLTDSHPTHTALCWLGDIFMAVVELFFLFFLCTEKKSPCCSCVWFRKKPRRWGAQPLQGQSAWALQQCRACPKHKAVIKVGPLFSQQHKVGSELQCLFHMHPIKGFWHAIVYYSSRQTWQVKGKTQRHSAKSQPVCHT